MSTPKWRTDFEEALAGIEQWTTDSAAEPADLVAKALRAIWARLDAQSRTRKPGPAALAHAPSKATRSDS